MALIDIRTGATEAALDRLRALERSAAATPGLQERASQLIVALEGGLDPGRYRPRNRRRRTWRILSHPPHRKTRSMARKMRKAGADPAAPAQRTVTARPQRRQNREGRGA